MKFSIERNSRNYEIDGRQPIDLSIPLSFNAPQPNAYGVERAVSKPVEAGPMIGDTRYGGSVNFEQYTFIPHCNGTHTECVGHITHERISVRDCLQDVLMPSVLISVEPQRPSNFSLTNPADIQIGRPELESALAATNLSLSDTALVVRTLPNDESKLTRAYGATNLSLSGTKADIPPYFSADAMHYIVERGFAHLLVDLPSIDRIFDEGKLLNHRIFWNVEEGSFETNAETRINSTITELIYVPNEVEDGEYLLNLQIAPFESDAAPSRPMLIKID